jgi:UDP-N-acetyl-2-amino-2-deoxyglucuronate dehydrogenase
MSNKAFGLIGAAGYIAARHMQAIREVGGVLHAALDPNDSVGIIDSYFPDAHFFTEFERFDRHVDLLHRKGQPIEIFSICSPNYLHDAHCRFALRSDADAICEKPLILNPWNIDGLAEMEQATGRRIFNVLQLRLHPAVRDLKTRIDNNFGGRTHEVDLTYVTSRGRWYGVSWKGDPHKSGGIATNIGVHFFDMLVHVFGGILSNVVHLREDTRNAGYLELERARVRWFLSVDRADLPVEAAQNGPSYRSITVDGEEFEFSGGFADLHTESYRQILGGNGFGIEEVRPSIEAVAHIREAGVVVGGENRHPFLR